MTIPEENSQTIKNLRRNPAVIITIVVVWILCIGLFLQLTGRYDFLRNPADYCPGIGDRVLCGICNIDKKLSDNPYAGQCRLCPADTVCSGDVCGEIKCTPIGIKTTPIRLENITYIDINGEELIAQSAYPGYVYILTDKVTEEEAKRSFEKNGGSIYSSFADAGIYIIQTQTGNESGFLSSMYSMPWFVDGMPVSPPAKSNIKVYDYLSDPSMLPKDRNWDCTDNHGNIVAVLADQYNNDLEIFDIPENEEDIDWNVEITIDMFDRLLKAWAYCENVVFSLSLQSEDSYLAGSIPRRGCTTHECKQIRKSQKIFFETFLLTLKRMNNHLPEANEHGIIVIAAGNAGVDLDDEINELRNRYPDEFRYFVIVGSLEPSNFDKVSEDFNFIRNNLPPKNNIQPSMVYASGKNVLIYENKKLIASCDGTSFSAPQVSAAIDYIWRRAPALGSTQVMEAFDKTLSAKGIWGMIPQKEEAGKMFIDPDFLQNAVNTAKTYKGKENMSGLWEGTYKSHYVSQEGWTCITDIDTPVKICITQSCQNVEGIINFPVGLKGKTTSPEEGAFCPPIISCSGGEGSQCSEFSGVLKNDEIFFDQFTVNGGSYLYNPLLPSEKVESSAIVANNTAVFTFSSYGSSGASSSSSNAGTITIKKVAEECK